MIDLRKDQNLSLYEVHQKREAEKDLDVFWLHDWSKASSTTSSSTTYRPSSYDIWLKDRNDIWVEERNRLITLEPRKSLAPSGPIVTPPEKGSVGKRLKSFIKGFRNAIPDID